MNKPGLFRTNLAAQLVVCLLLLGVVKSAFGEQQSSAVSYAAADRFESIWEGARLYQNDDATAVQSFSLVGRYHGQYWDVDSDSGDAEGWDNRRMIFGINSQLYDQFLLDLQMHIIDVSSLEYGGLYTASLKWTSKEKRFAASAGRLDYVYTGLERSTSSKRIVTIERGLLVGQLMPGEVVGLYTDTQLEALTIRAGVYSGDIGDEFSNFDAGIAVGTGFEVDFPLGYESGTLNLDMLYNDGDPSNNAFEAYQQIVSIWHQGKAGAFSMGVDYTYGGDEVNNRPDVYGLTIIPTYELLQSWLIGGDRLQLATRYQFARSDGINGLSVPRRYDSEVVNGSGDHYQAFYAGLNYLLYGDRLKLMAGVEYSTMKDESQDGGSFSDWTYLAGFRFYF